jgi:hypothetical protein
VLQIGKAKNVSAPLHIAVVPNLRRREVIREKEIFNDKYRQNNFFLPAFNCLFHKHPSELLIHMSKTLRDYSPQNKEHYASI